MCKLEISDCEAPCLCARPLEGVPRFRQTHVLIDRSPSNRKRVSALELVVCERNAGNLGNRLTSHRACDAFFITPDGDQVCARRADNPQNGWGVRW